VLYEREYILKLASIEGALHNGISNDNFTSALPLHEHTNRTNCGILIISELTNTTVLCVIAKHFRYCLA
jgi:hypothetical protein